MRGMHQISSLGNMKSAHSIGARSIPKAQRSTYLELYLLRREKDRLEKEIFALDKRKTSADRQLDSISKRIERLQKETHEEQKIKTYRGISAKPLKKMAINY
jgi:predicted  nucleic acid-binding Zn-ribbon protein